MLAHDMEYVATATTYYWKDLLTKVRKGLEVEGPAFLHVFAPCPRGWRTEPGKTNGVLANYLWNHAYFQSGKQ